MNKHKKNTAKRREAITAYLMMAPDIIGLLVFVFIPILYAFFVSLHDWNGILPKVFAGLSNYKKMIADDKFWKSLLVTLKYALIFIPSVFGLGLLLACLLNSLKGKAQAIFRTGFFMPYAISTVIAGLVWSFIYYPKNGYLNKILSLVGISNQRFLASPTQALPSVTAVSVWLVLGYNTILFLSAIKDIPVTYFEAADLDGANAFQKFFKITLPLIKNTSIFVIVTNTINSFQVFDTIEIMTGGGPANVTTTAVHYVYTQAFEISQMGYSTALAFVLFVFIMILTLVQMKFTANSDD